MSLISTDPTLSFLPLPRTHHRWTNQQDHSLIQLVQTHGEVWSTITRMFNYLYSSCQLSNQQCQKRWKKLKHGFIGERRSMLWTPIEDQCLIHIISEEGLHWERVAMIFNQLNPNGHRSYEACERRYRTLNKKSKPLMYNFILMDHQGKTYEYNNIPWNKSPLDVVRDIAKGNK